MTRLFLLAVMPMLLVLMLQPGCDSDSDALSRDADEPNSQAPGEAPAPPEATAETKPAPTGEQPEAPAPASETPDAQLAPSAYIVIQNARAQDPQLLVRQLQRVLPETQVVKLVPSPDSREIKLEVTNTQDVRALANKIPFAAVESIDLRTRTITVDFDL